MTPPLAHPRPTTRKVLHGVDVLLHGSGDRAALLRRVTLAGVPRLPLRTIERAPGAGGFDEAWRCRFAAPGGASVEPGAILALLGRLVALGLDVLRTEQLYAFEQAADLGGEVGA